MLAKELVTRTAIGRRALLASYPYAFTPEQLWSLCEAATDGLDAGGGAIVEIGVAAGNTTVLLNRHLASRGLHPPYYCLDTFSGFTPQDVQVERTRGKRDDFSRWFRDNSPSLFRRMLEMNDLADRVTVIQADAAEFDYSQLPPLAFALVDVDLLRPMQAALQGCWDRLLPGGVLVADDCQDYSHTWDGARQAYEQFCSNEGLEVDLRHEKLGFAIRRPV